MDTELPERSPAQGGTVWIRSVSFQLGRFVRTESASSALLIAAIAVALIWANAPGGSYDSFWATGISLKVGTAELSLTLRELVSSGLMTFFFLVVGLEARREFDLGTLRDRHRVVVPFAAGLAGMAVPVLIFLAFNFGSANASGWGVAMSTDTALALGLIGLVGRGLPEQVRAFIVTVFIVDDLVALAVIAVAYSSNVQFAPLLIAAGAFAAMWVFRRSTALGWLTVPAAVASWTALFFSGVDPIVLGLVIGLSTPAFVPGRRTLEDVAGSFREFREQPTPASARSAALGLKGALSTNEQLQASFLPWTSYVVVPLFALANAGIKIDSAFILTALNSPVTLGVFCAYVIGKPLAIVGVPAIIARVTRGRLKPPVGWAAVASSGTIAGVGFTVAVLVAALAFTGQQLAEAKFGVLLAAFGATILTWLVLRVTAALSPERRTRALLGDSPDTLDLTVPVDAARDHIRGDLSAPVTVVEYGDFQCPYCGRAESEVRELLSGDGVRFVWRNLPIVDVHPRAQRAAEAAEAAGAQGAFWPMHDLLLAHQDQLEDGDLREYATRLNLDVAMFQRDLDEGAHSQRIEDDVLSADLSGASGTPTFFINGRRHYGAYDVESLRHAVTLARDQVNASKL